MRIWAPSVALAAVLTTAAAASPLEQTRFSPAGIERLRNATRDLFFHSWDAYVAAALPADELRPLSCSPIGPDPDSSNIQRNDVMGNFSVTLLDTLDMFAILNEDALFEHYVAYVDDHVTFDVPSTVQVFETTIRAMGGLLSAHLYAAVPSLGHAIPGYNGHLLDKAYDLGVRLLPAFETPTGIPHPRVHLQDGVVPINGVPLTETCSAGAGSLLLEFALLSRLTGDARFESLAKRAFLQVWARRSDLNLVGMGIDAVSGTWLDRYTGVGASVDSFYEYALKYAILFDDDDIMRVWTDAYAAIQTHISSGWFYQLVDLQLGDTRAWWIDALTAFWAGVQVLAGDVYAAVQTHLTYFKLWNSYGGIPERWAVSTDSRMGVTLEWYLLRPEFLESTWYLYQATRDPFYLQVGSIALEDFEAINKVACGVAAVQDVRTGELGDRMDSFWLSETLKYLYLLFTPDHPLNRDDSSMLFSTEGHPFWSSPSILEKASAANFPRTADLARPDGDAVNGTIAAQEQNLLRWAWGLLKPSWFRAPWLRPAATHFASCFAWQRSDFIGSRVLSWEPFYALDEFIAFRRPAWLYRKTDMEHMHNFAVHYGANSAVCVPRKKSNNDTSVS